MSLSDPLQLVRDAESELRQMMRQAIAEQRYADLSNLASLAKELADLLDRHLRKDDLAAESVIRGESTVPKSATRTVLKARRVGPQSSGYPRFERDGSKLVKIGWSKRERAEYEHRAPRDAVFRVANVLMKTVGPGKVFMMDTVLPFKDSKEREIPAYQAYLALAWFRSIGAAEQRGKEGYVLMNGHLQPTALEKAWEELSPH